jgi:hypothetical protein
VGKNKVRCQPQLNKETGFNEEGSDAFCPCNLGRLSHIAFSLQKATRATCADLLLILAKILFYDIDLSGRSRRRSLMGNTRPAQLNHYPIYSPF